MASSSLGKKYVCFQCQAKFYDLNRPQAICPKCSADQSAAPPPPTSKRKGRASAAFDEIDDESETPLHDANIAGIDDDIPVDDDELELDEL